MKKLLENWRSYEKEVLNEIGPSGEGMPDPPGLVRPQIKDPPDRFRAPRLDLQQDMSKNEVEMLLRLFGDRPPGREGPLEAPKNMAIQAIQALNQYNYMLRGEGRAQLEEYIADPETTDAQIWLDTGGEYSSRRDIEDMLRSSWSHVIFDPYDPVDYANAMLLLAGGTGAATKAVTVAAKLTKAKKLAKMAENSNNILKVRAMHKKAGTLEKLQKSGGLKNFFTSDGKRIVGASGDLPKVDELLVGIGMAGEALQGAYWLGIEPEISAEFEESEIGRYNQWLKQVSDENAAAKEEDYTMGSPTLEDIAAHNATKNAGVDIDTPTAPTKPKATVTAGEPEIETYTDEDIDPETGLFPEETEEEFFQKSIDSIKENKNMKDLMENWRSYGASAEKDLMGEGVKVRKAGKAVGDAPITKKLPKGHKRDYSEGAETVKSRASGGNPAFPEGLKLNPEFVTQYNNANRRILQQGKDAVDAIPGGRQSPGDPGFDAYAEKLTPILARQQEAYRANDLYFEVVQDNWLRKKKSGKINPPSYENPKIDPPVWVGTGRKIGDAWDNFYADHPKTAIALALTGVAAIAGATFGTAGYVLRGHENADTIGMEEVGDVEEFLELARKSAEAKAAGKELPDIEVPADPQPTAIHTTTPEVKTTELSPQEIQDLGEPYVPPVENEDEPIEESVLKPRMTRDIIREEVVKYFSNRRKK